MFVTYEINGVLYHNYLNFNEVQDLLQNPNCFILEAMVEAA